MVAAVGTESGSEPEVSPDWFVYVVQCADHTLYTGVAREDVARRIETHNSGKGAKYTRGRTPVKLQASAGPMLQGDALRFERRLKKLCKQDKVATVLAWSA